MRMRKLGGSGIDVPVIGLGCMVMPGFYAAGSEEESIATLHRAAEIGVTMLDSSDLYGNGKNEELIGRAIAGRRDGYFIVTKFGNVRTPDGKPSVDGRPDYVQQACEASLKRLNIDTIDLYYQHRVDPTVPIEETVGAMGRLVEQGKVRFIGLSEAAPGTIRRGHATFPVAAVQTEYSLWSRDVEDEVLPLTKELGIAFVAYSPLGRGIFGGEVTGADSLAEGDRRRDHPRFQGAALERNLKLLEPVRALAEKKDATVAQIAIAWVLARGDNVIAIPGTRKIPHLEANAAAAAIELSPQEVAALDAAIPPGAAEGTRYPAGQLAMLNR
ncbi:MAG: aldo/keto reductase [Thalassobaculaceae bacterium]|nr:aldo/keto reductase [Thalassobaculaceae bacterium]